MIQQICDHGDYFELQPDRARNAVTAFGRLGGNVVGFVANNSAVATGQIDVDAAYKIARFVRFCNIYNIPMIFMEDTTGFLPGREQESRGIVQAGRAMLDSIVDLRTPRILLILRNAFGGAYASFNNYATGADLVLALPTTRVAVMGPAGKEFVYKDELRKMRGAVAERVKQGSATRRGGHGRRRGQAGRREGCRRLAEGPGGRVQPALRERADEPEGGALPRLDLLDRHAHRPAQGPGREPELLPAPLQARPDDRPFSASSTERSLVDHLPPLVVRKRPMAQPTDHYSNNPLVHRDRRLGKSTSEWVRSFACDDLKPLIVCRGPIRKEAIDVFREMGMTHFGILLSEKDSIVYPNALAPELRQLTDTSRVHRVPDYSGASKEERVERINQIIQIAHDNGYDSVFAGYGFMAEDEEFVAAIEKAGLKFIGPCSVTQARAGKKDEAKRTALEVKVSVTPGINNVTARTLLRKYPTRKQLLACIEAASWRSTPRCWPTRSFRSRTWPTRS